MPSIAWRGLAATMVAGIVAAGCDPSPRGGDATVPPPDSTSAARESPASASTPPPAPLPEPVATDEPIPARGPLDSIHAFTARGNEPFWLVRVDGGTLNYSTPELQPGKTLQAQRVGDASGVTLSGLDGGQPFTLRITDAPCQDSMSGQAFEFTATFQHGGQSMTGCARQGP